MPVVRVRSSKCGNYSINAHPSGDLRSVVNIYVIVEVNEIVRECLAEDGPGDANEEEVYKNS